MKNQKHGPETYRIAVYIRVSTEEQAENPEGSIRNQEQRLRDYVKLRNSEDTFGEIKEVFCDAGISAKDMNRPALQRMLSQVRSGEVNLVLVTEISRLTRATKDFALLWDFLKEHGCQFQSLRDNFDTTTPAGEMILFTLANFAQFERKQLGERISNAFQARAKRGLWNGGVIPLGYEIDPTKPGHLRVVPCEAEIVTQVFDTFFEEETLSRTGLALNKKGIKLPRKPRNGGTFRHTQFAIENTYRILTNKAYIGRRTYKTKDGIKETDAVWPALIEVSRFGRVQVMLAKNKGRKKPSSDKRYPYILSGIIQCKTCGDRLCGKSAHGNGGKIGYYEHAWAVKTQACLSKKTFKCEPHRILAKIIEPAVWSDVKRLLLDEKYAREIFEEAKITSKKTSVKGEVEKLRAKVQSIQMQIEATTERISQLPKEIDAKSFFDQILKLQNAKADFELKITQLAQDQLANGAPLSFTDFEGFAIELKRLAQKTTDPEVQAMICRRLIEKVEVSPSGITIQYHVGTANYVEQSIDSGKGLDKKLSRPFFISKPLQKYQNENKMSGGFPEETICQLFDGSNKLTNGRG